MRSIPVPLDNFCLWIFENIINGIPSNSVNIAYRMMAESDMIWGHIMELMEWSMYPQVLEIIRVLSTLTKKITGRIQHPMWFSKKRLSIEEIMNKYNISYDEAITLQALQKKMALH